MTNDARQEPVAAEKPEPREGQMVFLNGTPATVVHICEGRVTLQSVFGGSLTVDIDDEGLQPYKADICAEVTGEDVCPNPMPCNRHPVPVAAAEVLEHKITDEQIYVTFLDLHDRWERFVVNEKQVVAELRALFALTPPENTKP